MHTTKLKRCEQLFTRYEIERIPLATIAEEMDMSEYALRQLRKDPDYEEVRRMRRAEMREDAITQVHELGQATLDTMRSLLYAKSELVRFNAAKQLGDWLGLQVVQKSKEEDEREELTDFLKELLLQRQQVHVTVNMTDIPKADAMSPPAPGGLLPEFSGWTPDWVEPIVDAAEPTHDIDALPD